MVASQPIVSAVRIQQDGVDIGRGGAVWIGSRFQGIKGIFSVPVRPDPATDLTMLSGPALFITPGGIDTLLIGMADIEDDSFCRGFPIRFIDGSGNPDLHAGILKIGRGVDGF